MRCTDSKEGRITLQWLECRLVFLLTKNSYVGIQCGELEKAIGPCLIRRGGLTSLWQLESHSEFNASK